MNIFESAQNSINNIRAHKMRSFLTMLGMIIGISSVIIIMSIGASAQGLILNQIKSKADLSELLQGNCGMWFDWIRVF